MHNFGAEPCEIEFASGLKGERAGTLVNLLGTDHSNADKNGKHCVYLEGYGYRWYRVGGLDYLLNRTEY